MDDQIRDQIIDLISVNSHACHAFSFILEHNGLTKVQCVHSKVEHVDMLA